MTMFDDVRNKTQEVLGDLTPEQKDKIEQIARDKGISIEEAREHFFASQDKPQNQGDDQQQQAQHQGQNHPGEPLP